MRAKVDEVSSYLAAGPAAGRPLLGPSARRGRLRSPPAPRWSPRSHQVAWPRSLGSALPSPCGRASHSRTSPRHPQRGRTHVVDLVVCCVVVATTCLPRAVAAGEVQAGVAKEWFTLPKGVPLAGYGRRHGKPSTGVHDPVGVRALVISDDTTTAALVSCDLLIIDEQLAEAVHQRLARTDFPQNAVLLLAATHTHSGPGAYGRKFLEKISMGHFDPQVVDGLVQSITQAIVHAYAQRQPTRIAYGTLRTQGLTVNRVDPTGLVDDELVVSAFYPTQGETPFAVVLNVAAHPTTLGAWNMQLSADYPGVVTEELEHRMVGTTCLFVAGSVGDQAPKKAGSGFERAQRIGQPLAEQAMTLLAQLRPSAPNHVRALREELPLPPAQVRLGRFTFPRWLGQRFVDDDATVSLLAVGSTVFIGVPCDLAASLGAKLKQRAQARGLHPMIVGFANDYIGYCVPETLYREKQYESSMAFNGPKAGELLVERLSQMIDQLAATHE